MKPKDQTQLKPKLPIADKTIKTLATSIYENLKNEGCQHTDIIGISTQLIGIVTDSIKKDK